MFSQWTSLLDLIEPALARAELPFVRLDGSTRDRADVVSRFQDPAGPPVMLVSLKAGGSGLNLTAADHVFLCDPWWNPAVEAQAADRTHRIGQTRPVFVYRLVAAGTVEERILALQDSKRALMDAALGDGTAAAGPDEGRPARAARVIGRTARRGTAMAPASWGPRSAWANQSCRRPRPSCPLVCVWGGGGQRGHRRGQLGLNVVYLLRESGGLLLGRVELRLQIVALQGHGLQLLFRGLQFGLRLVTSGEGDACQQNGDEQRFGHRHDDLLPRFT